MVKKQRACKICKRIYEPSKEECPECGAKEYTESFKGRIVVFDPEKSEIAQKLNVKKQGNFAIKT
jgi:DNA-directed RNA polymerase subunit E"